MKKIVVTKLFVGQKYILGKYIKSKIKSNLQGEMNYFMECIISIKQSAHI